MQIKDCVIVITGASNGIGYETAKVFRNDGAIVYALDVDSGDGLEKFGSNYIKCDVSDLDEVQKACKMIYTLHGKIDVLINNAAKQIEGSFSDYNYKEYFEVMNTNYFGTCNCTYEALKYMKDNSTVLNVSSIHAFKPRLYKYAYDCSKSAIETLTKSLALELSERKITVNLISFGAVDTNLNKEWNNDPNLRLEACNKVPLNLIFNPTHIAHFIKSIIENFSDYTTGSNFVIDGGRALK